MAAVAAASHPALYDGGWHPTAVCAPIGAAVAASRLLALDRGQRDHALALAVLRAGGTRGAFGSDGKAIQVGLAAAAGVQAATLARAGARVDRRAVQAFERVVGARLAQPDANAIERNWIKFHPSCLGTHSPIDAAASLRERGYALDGERVEVRVHPLARQAAHLDAVRDGLEAKFSIPYCVAHTLIKGPPRTRDFAEVDPAVVEASSSIAVQTDPGQPEFGAALAVGGRELARVAAPRGSPNRPVAPSELADKVADLAGERLNGVLDQPDRPAAAVLDAAGLSSETRRPPGR
jgi:2-methylcitrate dehydratase PrpD